MPKRQPEKQQHDHPGGSGAILGVRVLRYSGVQGTTLVISNLIQLVSVMVVAAYLGPTEMGRFALLLFLSGLVTQLLSLLVKPGTIRRTFGGGDDEEDDDEDDEAVSTTPQRTLGTGLAWAAVLGVLGTALVVLLREPIAELLLGDPNDGILVVWAAILAGFWLVFKLADIVLWLERRPGAFVVSDTARPVLGLAALIALLSAGAGLEGAIAATAIGTAVGAVVAVILLFGSFEPSFDFDEIRQIIIRGSHRAPIVTSFWIVQNADVFILSRIVSDTDLGIYALASRLGFVVSFLPQGFRVAMRPLRKSAAFKAVGDQYGKNTVQGQLLGYFAVLCIFAVLAMVLGGKVLVDIAPSSYADAAGLIPFTAAAFVMPSIYRTVNQNVNLSHKRALFIAGCVGAAVAFIACTVVLAPEIGTYAAPIGMLVGFGIPSLLMFARNQTGAKPIEFPYRAVGIALLLAAAIGAGFQLLELSAVVELVLAAVLLVLFLAALVPLRVIPRYHRGPLVHTVRSLGRGTPADFRARRGLRTLEPDERQELRTAVIAGLPAERLAPGDSEEGLRLVGLLRRVGERGGIPVGRASALDAELAVFLLEDTSRAVRDASMRRLLSAGAESNDMRALEDLVTHLARVPDDGWEGRRAAERG
ncbi:MAG: lipopolysaccharide biosynthesis protein, partial [Solirubrobacterales bacterium]